MTFRTTGFTLVELMIVVAIIGIIAAAIYPATSGYYARGRDTARISDIKALSANFQNYSRTNNTYPSNTNISATTSYCISDMRGWVDAVAGIKDKQFSQLGGTGALKSDPMTTNRSFSTIANLGCDKEGSYQYARVDRETSYAILAARMERQTTGANYTYPDTGAQEQQLTNAAYIDTMMKAQPLNKNGNDINKIFLIITN